MPGLSIDREAGGVPPAARVPRATIKDVAALAGVGIKTVSRVVNGEPHVSEEKRRAVQHAIAQLRFRPNMSAAGLRNGQSEAIGLVIADIAEPFQSQLARAVEEVAGRRGWLLYTASSSDDTDREQRMVSSLAARRVDGLIIVPSPFDHSYLNSELDAGLPIVAADRPAAGVQVDCVLSNGREGARVGVAHLLERGHRRVAFVGDPIHVYNARERLAGYRDALSDAGVPYDPSLIFLGEPTVDRAQEALRAARANPSPATALFTGNSLNTLATLRAPDYRAHPVPHVAFDELPLADLLGRPLTVVAQDPATMGATAAELLFDRLDGRAGPPAEVIVPTRLIVRDSAEAP
ncbi:LacI family DNA-binding transcriptional regulator [Cellulomonas sp. ATA003]|uniref:LacI family DNA-binding transcriptional regulator n=1 Tax=Cellulomonas sp. ATA003 TaxID=3073064 RepID=UPI0028731446|nr:LacI family DNA-binding transcriptional regulator [Cellulomonas sp. ATA003]WNB87325.1 LacI family DNA-binding transcriptional regulator [Cellulomonas sp. ATA003]